MNKLVLQQERDAKEKREQERDGVILFDSCEEALEYMDAWWARHRMIVEQSGLE